MQLITTLCFSLIFQVSVLTDQVEVQGEKIRDLDSNLEHHRQKLDTTEGLLQQVGAAVTKPLVSLVQLPAARLQTTLAIGA